MLTTDNPVDPDTSEFEYLLSDDSFVNWVKEGKRKDDTKWGCFVDHNPDAAQAFMAAIAFIESVRNGGAADQLADREKSEVWAEISDKTAALRSRKNRKTVRIVSAVAAACLAGILFFRPVQEQEPEIVRYAIEHIADFQDVLMFVDSNGNVIEMTETEPELSYSEGTVRVNRDSVASDVATAYNQLIVPNGMRTRLTLSDGTSIIVNGGSRAVYPVEFTRSDCREVFIEGEAYFDVVRDTLRPFIVRTHSVNVEVLGTSFNISDYGSGEESRVVLVSGSVKASPVGSGDEYILKPDQMLSSDGDGFTLADVEVRRYVSWTEGVLFCRQEKLGDIARRLERYYGVSIHCDESIADKKYSGTLELKKDIEEILTGITFVASIDYTLIDGTYILSLN